MTPYENNNGYGISKVKKIQDFSKSLTITMGAARG
jgi:hypothetical protein